MSNRETLFITGFPGFIADRLLERLARSDCRVLLLVQPPFTARAKAEIARTAHLAGKPVDDFEPVEGYINPAEFGLTPANAAGVVEQTRSVIHPAADYHPPDNRQLELHVNVAGT